MSFRLYGPEEIPQGVHWFSASQIKLWKTCRVCYAYRYFDKVEQAPNAAAQRGVEIHKLLEDYLKEGKPIDPSTKYGKMALSGIEHLPSPGTCSVEEKLNFSYENIYFRGVIDCVYQKQNGVWTVLDHKTTKNFQYALSEHALHRDLQASLYAYYTAKKFDVSETELNWVYYLTAGSPKSKLVSCTLSLTEAEENVNLILDDCREMLDAKKRELTALDFEPPPQGCRGFGPCAVTLIGNQHKGAQMSSEKRSLKDLLDKRATEAPSVHESIVESLEGLAAIPETREQALEALVAIGQEQGDYEAPSKGFTLLIDCLPQKGATRVVELGDVLKHVFKQIAKDYGVAHHSFIPYESRGAFITRLDKHLTDNPLADGTIVLMSISSPDARDSIDVLINHAAKVFRASR